MNLPNKITIGRIIGTVIVMLLALFSEGKMLSYFDIDDIEATQIIIRRVIYVIMVISCFSDFADGYYARKYNLETDFGKLMDPLSDKIIVMAGLILLSVDGLIHPVILITILAREFAVTGLRSLAASKKEIIAASNVGKLKTILQMTVMGYGGLIWCKLIANEGVWQILWNIQLTIITIFTIYSGFNYFWNARHLYINDT